MNQIDLINALRIENGLSRKDAEAVVRLFFDEIKGALQKVTGWKFAVYAHFPLKNTGHIPAETQDQEKRLRLSRRSSLFSDAERN